jgi:deoxyribonuclease-4
MRLGAHVPTKGGLHNAFKYGEEQGCNTIQIFTKNPNRWKVEALDAEQIDKFKKSSRASKLFPLVAHDGYLINLASPNKELLEKSLEAFWDEIYRAEQLGIQFLVTHMGSHTGIGEETALKCLINSLNLIGKSLKNFQLKILLETTAGQGTSIGYKFEHLSYVLQNISEPEKFGICLDTCHLFAAGYDIRTESEYSKTIGEFDKIVGIDKIKMFHLNDSKKELGSRVDRHEHIGNGAIGLEGFRLIVNDPRFFDRPMIIETPQSETMNTENLKLLRSLVNNSQ